MRGTPVMLHPKDKRRIRADHFKVRQLDSVLPQLFESIAADLAREGLDLQAWVWADLERFAIDVAERVGNKPHMVIPLIVRGLERATSKSGIPIPTPRMRWIIRQVYDVSVRITRSTDSARPPWGHTNV